MSKGVCLLIILTLILTAVSAEAVTPRDVALQSVRDYFNYKITKHEATSIVAVYFSDADALLNEYFKEKISYHILIESGVNVTDQLGLFDVWHDKYVYPYKELYNYKIDNQSYHYETNIGFCSISNLSCIDNIRNTWKLQYPDVNLWIIVRNQSIPLNGSDAEFSVNINGAEYVVVNNLPIENKVLSHYLHELGHAMNIKGDNYPVSNCTDYLLETITDFAWSYNRDEHYAQDELNFITTEPFKNEMNESFVHQYKIC